MANICFRVDASNTIGMGHLMECISMAEYSKKHGGKLVFLLNDFPLAKYIVEKEGYECKILHDTTDASKVADFIKKKRIDILICDLFADRSIEYLKEAGHSAKVFTVILDDAKHREIPADIVINFNIVQDADFYTALGNATYLIGPKYVPLPLTLHEKWKRTKRIPENCARIFVNQGGSDPYGLTIKIINALESLRLKQEVIIVVGPAVKEEHKNKLKALRLPSNYKMEWGPSHEKILKLMESSDLAITAAGNTLYELAILGVPSIVVSHHKRHDDVAKKFAQRKAVVNLGIGTALDPEEISDAVKKLLESEKERETLSMSMKKIVDGLGSKRIMDTVLDLWKRYS